jgi:prolyl-tRNA editing enzyme YbaK/EbsC (Cys-tRNA(Pro) deacylase)
MSGLDTSVEAALEAAGMEYEVVDCDPEFADTAAFCDKYGYDPGDAANTILVAGKADPVKLAACVVLATTRLDVNKKVCQLLGVKRASFASGEQTVAATGMMIGGVVAVGLPEELPLYVDSRVMEREQVVMGGGNRSSKLILQPHELRKLPGLQVIENLAKPVV